MRAGAPSTREPAVPLRKIAIGAQIGAGGIFAGTLVAQLAAMSGISKVMNRVGDFFAGPIVKGILNLGKLNPFKWIWNKIIGGGSHKSGGDHNQGHGSAVSHGHH